MAPSTPFAKHALKWKGCTRCPLHKVRQRVCIARGKIPAEVIFIGEAPGISEDALGQPFIGPAGRLLDKQIGAALDDANVDPPSFCFSNLVGCIPKEEDSRRKKEEPLPEEIEACYPRLEELFNLVKPKLIVAVGSLSEKQAKKRNWKEIAKVISIVHPAYILRADVGQQRLLYDRVIIQLSDAFTELRD